MKKVVDFLNECKVFFVATSHDNTPELRPFGTSMEHKGVLYISTAKQKNVYKQMLENPLIQIVAIKPNSREWIRISGNACEENNIDIKIVMLNKCPILLNHFLTPQQEDFAVFAIKDCKIEYK